ncbi:MAG: hypothetical protein EOM20_00225 [Spartobacteria bacterium]|nr:hypothetical protein [Spartobacteria bacterium]
MSLFAILSIIVGSVLIVSGLCLLLLPLASLQAVTMFPRSRWPGWVLTAVDLAWVAYILQDAYLGPCEFLKPYIYPVAPVAFFLVIYYMDELLAPRALGGLLLLAGSPVLNAARWYDTSWRLYMVVLAYLWVIMGMTLVLSPFRFRKTMEFVFKTDVRRRACAFAGTLVGLCAVLLAVAKYR